MIALATKKKAGLLSGLLLLAATPCMANTTPATDASTITAPANLPVAVGSQNSIAAVKSRLTEEEWADVLKGEVVTKAVVPPEVKGKEEERTGNVLVTAIINHPPQKLWELMLQFEKYGEFLPKVEKMEVRGRNGNTTLVYHQLGIMWVDIGYTLAMTADKGMGRISWVLDKTFENDIKDTTGFYEFVPYDGGKKTMVSYQTWADTGRSVPKFVEDFLTKKTSPKILRNIRSRADEVYGEQK